MEGRLRISLSRFDSTYEEAIGMVDQIVDLTIALEALFGPGDGEELTHRLRLRSAFLLGRDEGEARYTSRAVAAMYNIRSRILHGGVPEAKKLKKWIKDLGGKSPRDDVYMDLDATRLAVVAARRIVRRAILGAIKMREDGDSQITWPLPDDFDIQIAVPRSKDKWVAAFESPIQEWSRFADPH